MSNTHPSNTHHALEFLESSLDKLPGVIVLFGDEHFLVRLVRNQLQHLLLADEEAELSSREFEGSTTDWRDVSDELSTLSLFSAGGQRVAVVENADPFVSAHRERLEQYVEHPAKAGVLILVAQSWPANTRLYKQVDRHGLQVDCRLPKKPRSSKIDLSRVSRWLVAWGKKTHQVRIEAAAADRLLDLIGPELGMLDQELAKLALFVERDQPVTAKLVDQVVGGWRTQTIWEAVDAALEGRTAEALHHLDRILHGGEHPVALFAQLASTLRRYAAAIQLLEAREHRRETIRVDEILKEVGVPHWKTQETKHRLRHLGRRRAGQLAQRLLDVDLSLKSSHSQPDRGRFALEQLLIELSLPKAPAAQEKPRATTPR